MLKKSVQQGRSERRSEVYPLGYVEDLNDARTMLADCFSILLRVSAGTRKDIHEFENRHDRITSIQDAPLVSAVGVYL